MSLRQIAKELGISPAYLSYMLNGKRPWRKDLYQRYMGVRCRGPDRTMFDNRQKKKATTWTGEPIVKDVRESRRIFCRFPVSIPGRPDGVGPPRRRLHWVPLA